MSFSPHAGIYHALAELLAGIPPWMAEAVCEWPLYADALRVAPVSPAARRAILALSEIPVESLEQRQKHYEALFGGAPRFWLYESAALTGRILGPQTFEVARIYRSECLEPAFEAELPDHASLELAFLAYMAEQADGAGEFGASNAVEWRKREREFIQEHGAWLIQLGRALADTRDEVYAPLGAFLADWLQESLSHSKSELRKSNRKTSRVPLIARPNDCSLCGFCVQTCPTHALGVSENESDTRLLLNFQACTGCGKCEQICNTKAITLQRHSALGAANGKPVTLRQSPRSRCLSCGQPTISQAELNYLRAQLGRNAWLETCLDCRPMFIGGQR